MKKYTTYLLLFFFCLNLQTQAQKQFSTDIKEYLLTLYAPSDFITLENDLNSKFQNQYRIEKITKVVPVYKIKFHKAIESAIIKHFKGLTYIRSFRANREVEFRLTPNDEFWTEQWALGIMEAHNAWDKSKGDQTVAGDDIVVAVLDNGFHLQHPDIKEQLYQNPDEIPNNGIDDDENGFIDDTLGWNFRTNTNNHLIESHGTGVSGVIGATTNNNTGIAGAAFNTKIICFDVVFDDQIIQALEYVYNERKLYNETNGEKGSFICAVNKSFGFSKEFPENFPDWCEMIEKLGEVGVLSITAVDNSDVFVDEVGDMPTLCPSDYSITVTRSNRSDQKNSQSGAYSQTHVDLAAPGDDILTIAPNNDYTTEQGTSYSTPLVAAAIPLLYAYPCGQFVELVKNNPSEAALLVKSFIMSSVDRNSNLEQYTKSGGRLNYNSALEEMEQWCETNSELIINELYPNPSSTEINIEITNFLSEEIKIEVYDMKGRLVLEDRKEVGLSQELLTLDYPQRLNSGIYFMYLKQANKEWMKKFAIIAE